MKKNNKPSVVKTLPQGEFFIDQLARLLIEQAKRTDSNATTKEKTIPKKSAILIMN